MAAYERSTSHTPAPGYLGTTSFSAVYQEDLHGLGSSPFAANSIHTGLSQRVYAPQRPAQVEKGAACLSLLADMPAHEYFVRRWREIAACITLISPFTDVIGSSIKSSLYSNLANVKERRVKFSNIEAHTSMRAAFHLDPETKHRTETERLLLQYSARIFENSLDDITVPPDCTLDQYAAILSDPNRLRWEVIGMWFTVVGLGACYVNDTSSRSDIEQQRRLAKCMLEASDMCLSFCEELGHMTDPETWLYVQNAHLASVVEGDASYMFWRRLGDLISACVTKGLHMEIRVSRHCPFWLSELRKRTFADAYNLDKSISSFMGRPPRLPRKYCAMQLPLDIELAHFKMSQDQLEVALEKLDENGWNPEGAFCSNLYPRTSMICNMIREDILDLTLASLPNNNIAVAEDILLRSRSAWASFPGWVREMHLKPHRDDVVVFLSNEIALNFKYNEFLLYRAIVTKFPHASANEELLRLSQEVLETVLGNVTQTRIMGRYECDLAWTLAKFALPTAGVLGLELLRQSQGLSLRKTSSYFNRSTIIQCISNLVVALQCTVLPLDGNYEICNQAGQVLQRILDRVLDPDPSNSKSVNVVKGSEEDKVTSDDYLWLDQVRSEPDFWASLPAHPLLAGFE